MAKRVYDDKADWQKLDAASLPEREARAYASYKEAYRHAATLRVHFEECLREAMPVPEGKRLVVNYNFGNLSVAVVDGKQETAKTVKSALSLADWIAQQQASGIAH